jgi:hypothetical protein
MLRSKNEYRTTLADTGSFAFKHYLICPIAKFYGVTIINYYLIHSMILRNCGNLKNFMLKLNMSKNGDPLNLNLLLIKKKT